MAVWANIQTFLLVTRPWSIDYVVEGHLGVYIQHGRETLRSLLSQSERLYGYSHVVVDFRVPWV